MISGKVHLFQFPFGLVQVSNPGSDEQGRYCKRLLVRVEISARPCWRIRGLEPNVKDARESIVVSAEKDS
jgi:hypothetical protein